MKKQQDEKPILSPVAASQSSAERMDDFVSEIRHIIDSARSNAVRSVDFCRVQMYWNIGRRIFEKEQQGK